MLPNVQPAAHTHAKKNPPKPHLCSVTNAGGSPSPPSWPTRSQQRRPLPATECTQGIECTKAPMHQCTNAPMHPNARKVRQRVATQPAILPGIWPFFAEALSWKAPPVGCALWTLEPGRRGGRPLGDVGSGLRQRRDGDVASRRLSVFLSTHVVAILASQPCRRSQPDAVLPGLPRPAARIPLPPRPRVLALTHFVVLFRRRRHAVSTWLPLSPPPSRPHPPALFLALSTHGKPPCRPGRQGVCIAIPLPTTHPSAPPTTPKRVANAWKADIE